MLHIVAGGGILVKKRLRGRASDAEALGRKPIGCLIARNHIHVSGQSRSPQLLVVRRLADAVGFLRITIGNAEKSTDKPSSTVTTGGGVGVVSARV